MIFDERVVFLEKELPIVMVKDLILKKGEVCHFVCESYYYYFDNSLLGSFKESGKIYITDKRIIFIGSEKTHTFQNSKILKYELHLHQSSDAYSLYIYKENQSKIQPLTISLESGKEMKEVLTHLFTQ